MLIKSAVLRKIGEGRIDRAFRRWRRPSVRPATLLHTQLGLLRIASVETVQAEEITELDAQAAGYPTLGGLRRDLARGSGDIWRITFGALQEDPRIALAETLPAEADLERLRIALTRLNPEGIEYALRLMDLIRERPGLPSEQLARQVGLERSRLKRDVRCLRALGLTRSLQIGYQLSPRGESGLARLQGGSGGSVFANGAGGTRENRTAPPSPPQDLPDDPVKY